MGLRWLAVTLKCGHIAEFQAGHVPVLNDVIYCRRCEEYQTVIVAAAKYNIRCLDCRFARNKYGHVRVSAERDISTHIGRRPSHRVQLWNGKYLEHTFTPKSRGQLELFQDPSESTVDDPPF